jgi:hypothetical protein
MTAPNLRILRIVLALLPNNVKAMLTQQTGDSFGLGWGASDWRHLLCAVRRRFRVRNVYLC